MNGHRQPISAKKSVGYTALVATLFMIFVGANAGETIAFMILSPLLYFISYSALAFVLWPASELFELTAEILSE